jgi:hypothetical protein
MLVGMSDKIRKQIDLDREVIKELKILAAHADKDVKNYLQDLIVRHVRELSQRSRVRSSNSNSSNNSSSSASQ